MCQTIKTRNLMVNFNTMPIAERAPKTLENIFTVKLILNFGTVQFHKSLAVSMCNEDLDR